MAPSLIVHPVIDGDSHTVTYVVWDPATKKSAVIDSVLDYNHRNVETRTTLADQVIAYIREHGLENEWILETHIHADHISASAYLQEHVGGKKAMGDGVVAVQTYLKKVFDLSDHFKVNGSQFDHLFQDNEEFMLGSLAAKAIHVPGHTPADVLYVIDGFLFMGDTLLAPDMGTARCDFPGGSAEAMYDSVRKILTSFPDDAVLYLCHDYPEGKNREFMYRTTVGDERRHNIHVRDGVTKDQFIAMRAARDKSLDLPAYIFPAVQINGNGGSLVSGEFIKLTLNRKVL